MYFYTLPETLIPGPHAVYYIIHNNSNNFCWHLCFCCLISAYVWSFSFYLTLLQCFFQRGSICDVSKSFIVYIFQAKKPGQMKRKKWWHFINFVQFWCKLQTVAQYHKRIIQLVKSGTEACNLLYQTWGKNSTAVLLSRANQKVHIWTVRFNRMSAIIVNAHIAQRAQNFALFWLIWAILLRTYSLLVYFWIMRWCP